MGRDGLTKLNISISLDKFGTAATMESFIPNRLQEVLNVNDEIFKPELGHCVTIQAKLFLQGAVPKFCKSRKLPSALKTNDRRSVGPIIETRGHRKSISC